MSALDDADETAARAARAEIRRARWTGSVVRRGPDLDKAEADFWRAVPPEERLGYVFDMWNEEMTLKDPTYEAPARLQRSVGGVRPRRG